MMSRAVSNSLGNVVIFLHITGSFEVIFGVSDGFDVFLWYLGIGLLLIGDFVFFIAADRFFAHWVVVLN
jgi:hypothetical protein